jgi:pSer/pThr/pTyr-binding forkhead associated (FHA) protein
MTKECRPYLLINNKLVYYLRPGDTAVGRANHNDIVILDLRVSRDHLMITEISGRYHLLDLNSSGGTYVNERQVAQRLLEPGDAISLAQQISLSYGEDPQELPRTAREYRRGAEQVYGKLHTSNLMGEEPTTPLKEKRQLEASV